MKSKKNMDFTKQIYSRLISLIGEDNFNTIRLKTIAIIGLGGVGGTVAEALFRSGFTNLILIDFDQVDYSNLNRQLLYNLEDISKLKSECAKKHLLNINQDSSLLSLNFKVDETSLNEYLKPYHIDFIIDAIDDVKGKIAIAKYSLENNIPFIMSMGMANKFNPSEIKIMRLDKTSQDPLAKKIRYEIKKANIPTNKIICACSMEKIADSLERKKLSSIIFPPSSAGLFIAYYVFSYFLKTN